jgi:hypothetical protein
MPTLVFERNTRRDNMIFPMHSSATIEGNTEDYNILVLPMKARITDAVLAASFRPAGNEKDSRRHTFMAGATCYRYVHSELLVPSHAPDCHILFHIAYHPAWLPFGPLATTKNPPWH